MKTTTIGIAKPCSENWESMTQNEKGRFCQSCKKTVVDLTNTTPEEISNILKTSKTEVCGMTFPEQLNTQILDLVPPVNWQLPNLNKAAGLLVAASLIGTQSIVSQTEGNNTNPPTEQQSTWTEEKMNWEIDPGTQLKKIEFISFEGNIHSEFTNLGVEHAKVVFVTKKKLYITYTDANGKFNLSLPEEILQDENIVIFEYNEIERKTIGDTSERLLWRNSERYANKTETLSKGQILKSFTVKVQQQLPMLGGLYYSDGREKDPTVYVDGRIMKYKEFSKERYTRDGEPKSNVLNETQYVFTGDEAKLLHGKKVEYYLLLVFTNNKD